MITNDTILRIKEAANVDEVVGEFVTLKKRGSRFIGLCPFHNEKTPSFTVTPSLNIYKCFGCGASGDPVKFLMEHEKLTYPDALKYLAAKYHIEIEETFSEKKDDVAADEKDSLYAVNSFAQKFFTHYLLENDEGKSIGFSYFKERGLTEDTIRKFQLGFAPESENALLKSAAESNFTFEQLQKAGLATIRNNKQTDFFRGRVMFPVHNMTGKVLAFGGRVLKKDSGPKYINTPETEIYHKSQILYGIFQAKAAIRKQDECILTEGYMDVISLAQAGIENVVASSGTSLTVEQVKLIKRLTPNITILYDGDPAGIKAALRGIDIILEENLNVRIVLLPETEDPDSFVQKNGVQEFIAYKEKNARDFILFKAGMLLKDVQHNPVKKTDAIKDIVHSIALIPDAIKRSMYIKECSSLFKVDEQILISETNKLKRNKLAKETGTPREEYKPIEENTEPLPQDMLPDRMDFLEKDVIRLLLEFAYEPYNDDGSILEFVLAELDGDNYSFSNETYQTILNEYRQTFDRNEILPQQYFLTHHDEKINQLAVEMLHKPYELSENWTKMHGIDITDRTSIVQKDLQSIIYKLKIELINQKIREFDEKINNSSDESELLQLIHRKQEFLKVKMQLAKLLGMVIV
jgi:DNA primase